MTTHSLIHDPELRAHLADLSSLAEERSRLQEEGERLDAQLLLLNTALWVKKLQSYAQVRGRQPFSVGLHCPLGPSPSPLCLALSLSLTNCTPVTLCTPSPACTLLACFDVHHLPTSAHHLATHSFPPPRPLLASSGSFTLSLSLSLPWSAAECTVDCSATFLYQLRSASSPSSSASPQPSRSFTLEVGRVTLSGADLSQAMRVAAPAPTLQETARSVLRRGKADAVDAAVSLPTPLTFLFSPISALPSPPSTFLTPAVSFSVALLSTLLAFDSRTASTTSMSALSSALYHHLLANPLHPSSPSKPLTPTTLRWCTLSPSQIVDIRLELRHIDPSNPTLTLPFLHLHCSSPTLLPAAHLHLAHRLAEFMKGQGGRREGEGALARYVQVMAGMGKGAKGGRGGAGDDVVVSSQWVSLLFDAHLLPRSMQHADQLSQVREAQRELAVMGRALRSDGAALSPVQASVLWQRCCHRLSALYIQSRRTGAADASSMEGALLVM